MKINNELLKKIRLNRAWSQAMLAYRAGLNLRTVQRVESSGVASLQTRRAIAGALDIDPAELDINTEDAVHEPREQARRSDSISPFGLDLKTILVGVYLILVIFSFGLVILDQLSAALIRDEISSPEIDYIFSEVADFLLQVGMLSLLSASAAIWFSWEYRRVRWWLLSSVLVGSILPALMILSINILAPGLWSTLEGNTGGTILRFSLSALTSYLVIRSWIELNRELSTGRGRTSITDCLLLSTGRGRTSITDCLLLSFHLRNIEISP